MEDVLYSTVTEPGGASSSRKAPLTEKHASVSHFPPTVKYIVGQEFCERFSYYGMRAILALYLNEELNMSENSATEAVHLFIVAAYFAPLLGAFISDSYIGKYRTIMYLSIVYCLGNWTLSLSAFSFSDSTSRLIAFLGLFLISFGTGGIKPCVSAFGGDQIELSFPPGSYRDQLLRMFFSAFYFSINVGATLSTVITPWARTTFHSYALAFSLPAGLMIVATFVFWTGRGEYVHQRPSGNVLSRVLGIMVEAFRRRRNGGVLGLSQGVVVREGESSEGLVRRGGSKRHVAEPGFAKPSHWLDRAKERYGEEAVEDVKLLLQVSLLFIPVPIFWSLFDQQASRWVFQAQKMNGKVGWFTIEPDQMQTANSLLILLMIPLFDQFIYPQLERRGVSLRPIRRMVTGMLFGVFAFVISGLLQLWMDSLTNFPDLLNSQERQLVGPWTAASLGNSTLGGGLRGSLLQESKEPFQCGTNGNECVSILWQLPQYVVMTAGEIMFSITGLELAYSQAPQSMTSVVSSFWCLTVAFGNLFTVLVVGTIGPLLTQAQEFFFFAAGCAVAMGILIQVGKGFTYVASAEEEDALA